MAVFPERIILKNSIDARAAIEAAIAVGGPDEIVPGELVVGIENGAARLYTLDLNNAVVGIAGGSEGSGSSYALAIVSDSAPTETPDGEPLVDGHLWFNGSTGTLSSYYYGAWVEIGGGIDDAPADGQQYARQDNAWTVVQSGTTGAAGAYLSETQTASSGAATFTGLGHSGTLQKVTSSLDAWIVIYGSDASRTSDSARPYDSDPALSSGVMAEFYVTAGSTVLATPGTAYFNNDTTPQDAIYVAVRDQAGSSVDSAVTIAAYGQKSYTGVSGGTFGSG